MKAIWKEGLEASIKTWAEYRQILKPCDVKSYELFGKKFDSHFCGLCDVTSKLRVQNNTDKSYCYLCPIIKTYGRLAYCDDSSSLYAIVCNADDECRFDLKPTKKSIKALYVAVGKMVTMLKGLRE